MKKTFVLIAVATLVVAFSVGAYAYYGNPHRGWGMQGAQPGMYGQRGGGMMYGQRGGKGGYDHDQGMMMRGRSRGRWNSAQGATCPCGAAYGTQNTPAQQNAPAQQLQMVSEEKVKEAAESYLKQYLSGYTIDKIEKDNWRPLYFVTVKSENDAVQTMVVHGFSGEVVNVFPQAAQ